MIKTGSQTVTQVLLELTTVAQAGLELPVVLRLQPPESWVDRHMPPCPICDIWLFYGVIVLSLILEMSSGKEKVLLKEMLGMILRPSLLLEYQGATGSADLVSCTSASTERNSC